MRSDHAMGERDVGQVFAESVEQRVGRVRRAGQREILNAGERRPVPAR
jgi:hypothetical protein